jgi:hypothetical protein
MVTIMFAIAEDSLTYHLVDAEASNTLCGLQASEPSNDSGDHLGVLRVISEVPINIMLCEACSKCTGASPKLV